MNPFSPRADRKRFPLAMQPSVVRSYESLTGSPIRFIGKETFVKLAGDTTPGSITILQDTSPAHHGPPLHLHDFEEFFYILSGKFLFEVEGQQFEARPGDFAYAPPGVPHVFQNVTDEPATMLVIARPGGLEDYFLELSERMMSDPGNVNALNAVARRYGVTVLGPPMASRNQAVSR